MFPVTITLNTADQLNAVLAALGNGSTQVKSTDKPAAEKTTKPEATTAKKSDAATASAGTTTTAAGTDAQDKKEKTSAEKPIHGTYTPEERNVVTRKAIAAVGRDTVIALLAEFGVAKAGEITNPDQLAVYDLRLTKLSKTGE